MNNLPIRPFTFQTKGKLWEIKTPIVMGIMNVTADSFYSGSRISANQWVEKAAAMFKAGATILDIGGQSTRPGSTRVSAHEEMERVIPCLSAIHDAFPLQLISIDTFHAEVASEAVRRGAAIINDISAGQLDHGMWETVAKCNVPYVLMHMQGEPSTMQQNPQYSHVTQEVFQFFSEKIIALRAAGVKDILLDPGFGFGKNMSHNYQLMRELEDFHALDCPIMVGISRKKMVQQIISVDSEHALNGTTALHMMALQKGAKILRAHDVKEAKEAIQIYEAVISF